MMWRMGASLELLRSRERGKERERERGTEREKSASYPKLFNAALKSTLRDCNPPLPKVTNPSPVWSQ